jgi:hypothetical protein
MHTRFVSGEVLAALLPGSDEWLPCLPGRIEKILIGENRLTELPDVLPATAWTNAGQRLAT